MKTTTKTRRTQRKPRVPGTLAKNRIMSFVGVRDPESAKQFYRDKLGLRLVEEQMPFALVFDAAGIMLRVTIVGPFTPHPYTVLGWETPDIVVEIGKLTKRGVIFERFPGLPQDSLGIWTAPGGAKIAWFKDPDGNILSLTQF
jgi:catechol 2,3-dioxygenase-like lactoylglutathione lyase family enzyme